MHVKLFSKSNRTTQQTEIYVFLKIKNHKRIKKKDPAKCTKMEQCSTEKNKI